MYHPIHQMSFKRQEIYNYDYVSCSYIEDQFTF
jgi:hypothetical protein